MSNKTCIYKGDEERIVSSFNLSHERGFFQTIIWILAFDHLQQIAEPIPLSSLTFVIMTWVPSLYAVHSHCFLLHASTLHVLPLQNSASRYGRHPPFLQSHSIFLQNMSVFRFFQVLSCSPSMVSGNPT